MRCRFSLRFVSMLVMLLCLVHVGKWLKSSDILVCVVSCTFRVWTVLVCCVVLLLCGIGCKVCVHVAEG